MVRAVVAVVSKVSVHVVRSEQTNNRKRSVRDLLPHIHSLNVGRMRRFARKVAASGASRDASDEPLTDGALHFSKIVCTYKEGF